MIITSANFNFQDENYMFNAKRIAGFVIFLVAEFFGGGARFVEIGSKGNWHRHDKRVHISGFGNMVFD